MNNFKKICFMAFALLLSIACFACTPKEEKKEVKISLNEASVTLGTGETKTLVATVEGSENEVEWSSSNEAVATVEGGVVTAIAEGNATITASVDGKSASTSVTVKDAKFTVTFVDDEGHILKEEQVAKGASATAPQVANKTGYDFVGWDKDFTNVTSDLEIKAQFAHMLTIKYVLNGGYFLNEEDAVVKYAEGAKIDLVEAVCPGTRFDGWATTASGTTYVKNTSQLTEDETILYAQFTDITTFNITYNFNGGISSEGYLNSTNLAKASYTITAFNANPASYWGGGYSSYVYLTEKSSDPGATFSDRIYIGLNSETGMYEVKSILTSGGSSWHKEAQYVLTVSNSYSGFNDFHNAFTSNIEVGDTIVFSRTPSATIATNNIQVYAFNQVPEDATYQTTIKTKKLTTITPSRLGFDFKGWFDAHGDQIVYIEDLYEGIELIAKWEEKTPVTAIEINEVPEELVTGETFAISAHVLPLDAYFQNIYYVSSNPDIVSVDENGKLVAENAGTATISIYDYLKKVTLTKEITVYSIDCLDIAFEGEYNGVMKVNDTVQLKVTAYGKNMSNLTYTYTSSDPSVASVSSTGLVTALKEGVVSITAKDNASTVHTVEVKVTVKALSENDKVDEVLKLIVENNFAKVEAGNVCLYNDGNERYYMATYGSVNNYLFDEYKVDTTYTAQATANLDGTKTRRDVDTIEFVCVHDTATLTGTVKSIASGMSAGDVTIHYTVGNGQIYKVVDESRIAFHAGDGTGSTFTWFNTGVKATDPVTKPVFSIMESGGKYYFGVNGTITKLEVPSGSNKLTYLGPTWKVVDGYYYMGLTWYSSSYGYVSSHGGNNNSIGIETNVNTSNDMYDTWQRTAQLVADILLRNNLDTTRVYMHNTFSGKNCPQNMLAGEVWPQFMKMVELQYTLQKDYSDVTISMVSNNPEIVNNLGRVYKAPEVTTTVSYTVTVTSGNVSKSITLYSVVPGTTTWEQWYGRYPASRIWNNGVYNYFADK